MQAAPVNHTLGAGNEADLGHGVEQQGGDGTVGPRADEAAACAPDADRPAGGAAAQVGADAGARAAAPDEHTSTAKPAVPRPTTDIAAQPTPPSPPLKPSATTPAGLAGPARPNPGKRKRSSTKHRDEAESGSAEAGQATSGRKRARADPAPAENTTVAGSVGRPRGRHNAPQTTPTKTSQADEPAVRRRSKRKQLESWDLENDPEISIINAGETDELADERVLQQAKDRDDDIKTAGYAFETREVKIYTRRPPDEVGTGAPRDCPFCNYHSQVSAPAARSRACR